MIESVRRTASVCRTMAQTAAPSMTLCPLARWHVEVVQKAAGSPRTTCADVRVLAEPRTAAGGQWALRFGDGQPRTLACAAAYRLQRPHTAFITRLSTRCLLGYCVFSSTWQSPAAL